MAQIADLGYRSISVMTPEEAVAFIKEVRIRRRTPAKPIRKATAQHKAKAKKSAPKDPFKGMSKDAAAKLLEEMKGLL